MTQLQYERWRDFALRMARTCFVRRRRPDSKWIEDVVVNFFDSFDEDDIPTIKDWDDSGPYPDGRRETWKTYCSCEGRHETGKPNPKCPECRGSGVHFDFVTGPLVCDFVTTFLDSYMGTSPVCKACSHENCRQIWPHYEDTCPICEQECRCDDVEQLHYDQWSEQWGGPVRCCIRAGLDTACAPSAGVVGFTAGDVRRMFPEGVPNWVFPPNERLHYWLTDEVNGTFAELPDTARVVL